MKGKYFVYETAKEVGGVETSGKEIISVLQRYEFS